MLAAARDLYGLPPADFTAARNQLAKQLKSDGQADDAKAIGGLRRPKVSEYALNRVARDNVDVVRAFADAVASAQKAQAAAIGGDAGALRDATNALRQANAAVVDAAVRGLNAEGGNGEAQRDDIVALLREFISGANATPLVAGVVGSEALIAADEFFPGAPEPPKGRHLKLADKPAATDTARSKPAARGGRAQPPPPEPTAPKPPSASAASTAAAKRAMRRAEHTRLKEAVRAAESAVAKASAAVDAAQTELVNRRAALKSAQAAQKAAAKELDEFTPD